MKMNKKLLGLIMSAMLAVPMFGCSDDEVEQLPQQPQVQQEQVQEQPQENVQDEDLNDEYKAMEQENDLQKAKDILEPVMNESFGYGQWMFAEVDGGLGIVINAPDNDVCFNSLDDWNEMINVMIDLDYAIQYALQQQGINIQTGIMIADIDQDVPYAMIVNQEVLYDVFNNIDKIN